MPAQDHPTSIPVRVRRLALVEDFYDEDAAMLSRRL